VATALFYQLALLTGTEYLWGILARYVWEIQRNGA
jgi:hypothetical protein